MASKNETEEVDVSETEKQHGAPPKAAEVENTVVRLAEENTWGYRRIVGEMRKLGHDVSASYVRDVLKRHGLPPSSQRKGLSWKQFIQSHVDVTWAADFFTEEVWTARGLVTFYILFFIHLGTRRVYVSGATPNPNAEWVKQQGRNFCVVSDEHPNEARYLIHDRDGSFLPLDFILDSEGISPIRTPPESPNCNAFAERWIREARETLNQFIIMGQRHLMHILKQIESHHNTERPHQGLDNRANRATGHTGEEEECSMQVAAWRPSQSLHCEDGGVTFSAICRKLTDNDTLNEGGVRHQGGF